MVCERFRLVPAGCGRTPARGQGQRLEPRSTRVAGLVLTPIPNGAESVRGSRMWCCGLKATCFQSSEIDGWRDRGSGCQSSLRRDEGGMECYGRDQAGQSSVSFSVARDVRPQLGPRRTALGLASGLLTLPCNERLWLHELRRKRCRAAQRSLRSPSRRRDGLRIVDKCASYLRLLVDLRNSNLEDSLAEEAPLSISIFDQSASQASPDSWTISVGRSRLP